MAGNRIPWLRVGVEGAAIVLSILLAFAIDAWWTEQQTRAEEQEVLRGLRSDFAASKDGLQTVIGILDAGAERFQRFEQATHAELAQTPSDSVELVVVSLAVSLTYDPVSSALEALINDGRLGLIRDGDLRESLATWRRALEDIEENASDVRSGRRRVQRSMERYGGPFRLEMFGEATFDLLPEPTGQTLAALRRDEAFVGEVRSRYYGIAFYLLELRELLPLIDSILANIDANVQGVSDSDRAASR